MPDLRTSFFAALGTRATSDLRQLLDYGLDDSVSPPHVSGAAEQMGIPRRTLAARLQRNGLPPPGRILQWCVVLRACDRLSGTRKSVDRVAEELGLAKSYTLRRLLKRYLRCTPAQLRGQEHCHEAINGFVAALVGGRLPSTEP